MDLPHNLHQKIHSLGIMLPFSYAVCVFVLSLLLMKARSLDLCHCSEIISSTPSELMKLQFS